MNKKWMVLLLAGALSASLCACGSTSAPASGSDQQESASAAASDTSSASVVQDAEYETVLREVDENGELQTYEMSGRYSGPVVNGVPEGEGEFVYTGTSGQMTYTGGFSEGYFDGYGEFTQDGEIVVSGNFDKGTYAPSKADFLLSAQEYYQSASTLTPAARDFIGAHDDLFPCETEEAKAEAISLTDSGIEYKMITKSPNQFGEKLLSVNGLSVIQIFENPVSGYTLTWILAADNEFNYYAIYYLGSVDVFEDDAINVRGLPMGVSNFDNVSGGTTNIVVLAGSIVEKA